MFIFYSKGKKKEMHTFKREEDQPTINHLKMTATDIWASASVLWFFRKCKFNVKQAFSHNVLYDNPEENTGSE